MCVWGLQAAVRALARMLRRMPAREAEAALQPELLPRLFQALAHPTADVRKAVRIYPLSACTPAAYPALASVTVRMPAPVPTSLACPCAGPGAPAVKRSRRVSHAAKAHQTPERGGSVTYFVTPALAMCLPSWRAHRRGCYLQSGS